MTLNIGQIAAVASVATVVGNLLFGITSGSFSVGVAVHEMRSELKVLSTSIKSKDEFNEFRFKRMETLIQEKKQCDSP